MFNFLHWYHCYHDNFFIIVIMLIFVIIVIMIILIIIVIMISSVLSLLSWYHLCYHCYHVIFCVIIVIMISSVLSLLSWYYLCYHFYHVIFWPRGDSGTIGSSNLSTVTNMNIDEVDLFYSLLHLNLSVWNQNLFNFLSFLFQASIVFKVTDGPFYGHLFVEDEVGLATISKQCFWKCHYMAYCCWFSICNWNIQHL